MSIANKLKPYRISNHSSLISTELKTEKANASKAVKSSREIKEKPIDIFINKLESKSQIVVDNIDSVINISFGHFNPSLLPKPITKQNQNHKTNENLIKKSMRKNNSAHNIQEIKTKQFIQKRELSLQTLKNNIRNSDLKILSAKPSFYNKNTEELKCFREKTKSPPPKINLPSEINTSEYSVNNKLNHTRNKVNKLIQHEAETFTFHSKSINKTSIPSPTNHLSNNSLHIQTWVNNTLNWQRLVDQKLEQKRKENEEMLSCDEKYFFTPNTVLSKHNSMSYLNFSKKNLLLRRSNSVSIHDRLYNYKIHIQSNKDKLTKKNKPSFTPSLYYPKKRNKKSLLSQLITPPNVFSYKKIKQKQIESKQKRQCNLLEIKKQMRNKDSKEQEILLKGKQLTKKSSQEYIKTILDKLYNNHNSKKKHRFVPGEDLYRLNIRTTSSCEIESNKLFPPKGSAFIANHLL